MTQQHLVAGAVPDPLLAELRQLIDTTRQQATVAVNMGLTLLYWRVGQRINAEVLQGERAAYGEQIVATLSRHLTIDYGRSFGPKNLRHMMRFAERCPDIQIVSALSRQLSWSHFLELIYLKDALKRDFYAEMTRIEGWSVRELRERMGSMLYERTALSREPEDLIRQELDRLRVTGSVSAPLLLKDPYILASTWPNASPCCPHPRSCSASCTLPSKRRGHGSTPRQRMTFEAIQNRLPDNRRA